MYNTASNVIQGVTEFMDDAPVSENSMGAGIRPDSQIPGTGRADISDFFARPVNIGSFEWSKGSTFAQTIDLYSAWKSNSVVARKLENYQLFRGNFHIRVLTNGSKFHIGALQVKWFPPYIGTNVSATAGDMYYMYSSQKPGTDIPISPSENTVFEMDIPFLCNNDFLNIPDSTLTDSDTLGSIVIDSLTVLDMANAAIVPVGITVLVWVTEPEIQIPTITTASGSEQDSADATPDEVVHGMLDSAASAVKQSYVVKEVLPDRIVSQTTSAIASAMGAFNDLPVIGPYAAVGSKYMNKAAKFVSFFGLSRPNIVTDPVYVKNQPISSLANVDGNETVSKLSFDPRQGITIDPRVVGLSDGVDQMSIQHISRTWSYLTSVPLETSDTAGTLLFESLVTPNLCVNDLTRRAYTSMAYAAMPFEYWSGSVEFRFVFVVSKYHSARLALSYDPYGTQHAADPSNEQFNHIIDVEGYTSTEHNVGWAQARAYQKIGGQDLILYDLAGVIYNSDLANGSVRLTVLNPLRGPDSTVGCNILVYVRAGPDFEVFMPKSESTVQNFEPSTFDKDGQFVFASGSEECQYLVGTPATDKMAVKPTIFGGEKITSFRSLIKRYSYHRTYRSAPVSPGTFLNVSVNNLGYPTPYMGGLVATDQLGFTGTTSNVHTPLMTWLRPAFATWRGGVRWKWVLDGPSSDGPRLTNVSVTRGDWYQGAIVFQTTGTQLYDATTGVANNSTRPSGWSGSLATSTGNQPAMEYEVPFYNQFRYCYPSPDNYATTNVGASGYPVKDGSDQLGSTVNFTLTRDSSTIGTYLPKWDIYVAAGDDFSFDLYVGAPVYFKQ